MNSRCCLSLVSVLLFAASWSNQSQALKSGIDTTLLDRQVVVKSPEDLPRFASGTWMATFQIPEDKMRVDVFDIVSDNDLAVLHQILDSAASNRSLAPNSPVGRVGLFYRVALDELRADRLGLSPIAGELDEINKVANRSDLMRVVGDLQSKGVLNTCAQEVTQDDLRVNLLLPSFQQGGLTLPDPSLYSGMASAMVHPVYVRLGAELLSAAGFGADAKAQAEGSFNMERDIALISRPPEQLRDITANYSVLKWTEFQKSTPSIDWLAYALGANAPVFHEVIVRQPKFFKGLDDLVKNSPLDQWKSYLRLRLLITEAPYLTTATSKILQQAIGSVTGQTELPPRWKRAEQSTDAALGEDLGQLYVAKSFSSDANDKIQILVNNVLAALATRIKSEPWMSEQTKAKALAKLSEITVKVGYPRKWRSYRDIEIRDDSWAANVMRASRFEWVRQFAKLGRRIDRSEWSMTPPTVNAYYNRHNNEIVFPAGILQPGFYDPNVDDAANYGAIGMIIGHEITHGFDDQGSQYDGHGRRVDWWSLADKKLYLGLTDEIADQFSKFSDAFGHPVNGRLTLGENIADVGGLAIAYDAYHRSLNGKMPPVIDGFTGDQRFFISAAQMYRGKSQAKYAAVNRGVDPHSPDEVRAFAPESDQVAFYRAFGLPVPNHLPHVW